MADQGLTIAEWIVACLVAGESADPDMHVKAREAVDTLRTIRATAGLLADLHGVTLDEPVGFEVASRIVGETSALIGAGMEGTR